MNEDRLRAWMEAIMGEVIRPLDISGIPEFFHTTSHIEDAGFGLIRIVRCIQRNHLLVPVCSTIAPISAVIALGTDSHTFAKHLLRESCSAAH